MNDASLKSEFLALAIRDSFDEVRDTLQKVNAKLLNYILMNDLSNAHRSNSF